MSSGNHPTALTRPWIVLDQQHPLNLVRQTHLQAAIWKYIVGLIARFGFDFGQLLFEEDGDKVGVYYLDIGALGMRVSFRVGSRACSPK